ncbi:hypothetical protein GCM10027615_57710 [Plantactinospora veratri]
MEATIEARGLRKRYGSTVAVHDLSFTVPAGRVTGFVGPNGAGKSTTMRMILGLDAPDGGTALVGGRPYHSLRTPLREVGALLDAGAVHPGRRARDHLLWMAHSNGLPTRRVDEVIEQVGLGGAARRRAGGFSSACGSGWASPRRCSATRRCCSSTSRSTGSTRRASGGSVACSGRWPPRGGPYSSPAT